MPTRTTSQPPKHATRYVRNQSSRLGAPIQGIGVHSTESADIPHSWDDLRGVGNWFDNPDSDASSHLGIDGDGHSSLWVPFAKKAWTILQLNDRTVNIEFVGRAAQPAKDWEIEQIKTGAKWAAYISLTQGVPLQRGKLENRHGYPIFVEKGIITHKQLSDIGFGTHQDPGPKFPIDEFIDRAQWYKRNGWYVEVTS